MIDGYENDPIVDGESLLELPGFWAEYLLWLCDAPDEDEDDDPDRDLDPDAAWFGVTDEEFAEASIVFGDESRWPVIQIPLADGHTVVVLGRNFDDDAGIEYFVTHPDWGRHGYLATLDGHQAGPGLSWAELIHIARQSPPGAPGVSDPDHRLLLLIPALGDMNLPADAAETVVEALVAVGCAEEFAPVIARRLLDSGMWELARWSYASSRPADGGEPFAGILECDGARSPRCGIRLAEGIAREQSDRLARALGTWPGAS